MQTTLTAGMIRMLDKLKKYGPHIQVYNLRCTYRVTCSEAWTLVRKWETIPEI